MRDKTTLMLLKYIRTNINISKLVLYKIMELQKVHLVYIWFRHRGSVVSRVRFYGSRVIFNQVFVESQKEIL